MSDERRAEPNDELPKDLDVTQYVGPYVFPNITRRRIPGAMYAALAVLCFGGWVVSSNGGLLAAGVIPRPIPSCPLRAARGPPGDHTPPPGVAGPPGGLAR